MLGNSRHQAVVFTSMTPRVFTIPGLGFTPDVFSQLDLGDSVRHLEWLEPLPEEHLSVYAKRIATPIEATKPQSVVLVGHSFGGVLALQIAMQQPIHQVILISSIKTRREIPLWLRIAGPLNLDSLLSRQLVLKTLRIWGPPFGYAAGSEQALFRKMLSVQSNSLLRWQLRQLSRWQGHTEESSPSHSAKTQVSHFHGDRDRTLPFSRIKEPVCRIAGGTHLMVFNRADTLSPLVRSAIRDAGSGV